MLHQSPADAVISPGVALAESGPRPPPPKAKPREPAPHRGRMHPRPALSLELAREELRAPARAQIAPFLGAAAHQLLERREKLIVCLPLRTAPRLRRDAFFAERLELRSPAVDRGACGTQPVRHLAHPPSRLPEVQDRQSSPRVVLVTALLYHTLRRRLTARPISVTLSPIG